MGSKGAFTQVTQERVAELREAWTLVADKKTALTSKEVYRVYRALGYAPTEEEHRTYFVRDTLASARLPRDLRRKT